MSGAQSRLQNATGQRGQAAVLSALCLFTMVLFLALATNTGILVNDRIRMQNTADLTAYAGGFEQARFMNMMAEENAKLYEHVQRIRTVLNYGPAYGGTGQAPDNASIYYWRQKACSCGDTSPAAEAYIDRQVSILEEQAKLVVKLNEKALKSAKKVAKLTASRNFLGPNVSERHLDFFEDSPASPTYSGDPLVDLDQVTTTRIGYNFLRSCRCCDGCCLYPQVKVREITTWYYKDPAQGQIYFPAMVKGVPLRDFLDVPGRQKMFGADASNIPGDTDMLYGYAAAKPFEGNIGTSNPVNGDYSERPEQEVYPPDYTYQDYFRATYRARVSGIHEEMGTDDYSHSMADLIEADTSEPKFQSKTRYFTH